MEELASVPVNGGVTLPAWRNTCDVCDVDAKFIPHTTFRVVPNRPVVYPPVGVKIVEFDTPTREYHAGVKRVTEWLEVLAALSHVSLTRPT